MSLLKAEDIAVHFGGVKAVDGVSFEVEAGEVFAIIGPSGVSIHSINKGCAVQPFGPQPKVFENAVRNPLGLS